MGIAEAIALAKLAAELGSYAARSAEAFNNGDEESGKAYLAEGRQRYAAARQAWDDAGE